MSFMILLFLALAGAAIALYAPVKEYSGPNFFADFDFYGNVDNTTWGNVSYVDQQTATSEQLAYVNAAGHAILRVDNTTNITQAPLVNRHTVRVTSKAAYPIGSLFIADLVHMPYGCSVWPSLWTLGQGVAWPSGGEIDMVEYINLMGNNQMSVHTGPGCVQASSPKQSGRTLNQDCSNGRGCSVAETKPNSSGEAFANAGGGVFAMQFDVSGIYMWFWSRPDVPASISQGNTTSTIDTADWGIPSSAYPSTTCDMAKQFTPQQIVINISLCGAWAGIPSLYSATCPGTCLSNIFGSGNPIYSNAWFEIQYIRVYSAANASSPTPTSSNGNSETMTTVTDVPSTSPAPSQAASLRTGSSSVLSLLATLFVVSFSI